MSDNGPKIRLVLLWHMHQPFYKDMVTGEYRLPWVRLHALKDYYGMVKLAEEFPDVHQNFNLVPSLVTQIQDYVSGKAHDPFLDLVSKPANDLSAAERRFALQYLFQANPVNMIGRYPRYRELLERYRATMDRPEGAESYFVTRDYADLQVLSQLAWFDEYFLSDPEIAALIRKGEDFSRERSACRSWRRKSEILAKVIPEYSHAAGQGWIELSTTPFYHPILPLICDTNAGAESTPGLPLPTTAFPRPDDAAQQIQIGHWKSTSRRLAAARWAYGRRKEVFPRKCWHWPTSRESSGWRPMKACWRRTISYDFARDSHGRLHGDSASSCTTSIATRRAIRG